MPEDQTVVRISYLKNGIKYSEKVKVPPSLITLDDHNRTITKSAVEQAKDIAYSRIRGSSGGILDRSKVLKVEEI